MQVICKKTGKDMTSKVIQTIEKSLDKKIIKTNSNTVEFDKWLEKLAAKNGTTNY